MRTWLDLLTEATKELEPPERYFWWSGVAAISAIVKKNVFLDRFSYVLYPNVYVLLISARSALRKGPPVAYAKSFVEAINCTRVISGRNSIQGVLKELSTIRALEDGTVLDNAQAFLCAPEMSSFMVSDPEALTLLTDLHDTHAHPVSWKNTLKSSPVEELKEPCITLLAASNEPLFEELITSKDIEGGFIGRSFIIREEKRRTINSLMFPPESLVDKVELGKPLLNLRGVKGRFTIDVPVRKFYQNWYNELAEVKFEDKTGTLDRIGDQVLKLAMIVSLAREILTDQISLNITQGDMQEAIEKCEFSFSGTKQVTMGGKSELAPAVAKVLKELLRAPEHEIERAKLLGRLKFEVDSQVLDKVIDTLGSANGSGAVEQFRGSDRKIYLRLKQWAADEYLKMGGDLK